MSVLYQISIILAMLFSGIAIFLGLIRVVLGLTVLPMMSLNTFAVRFSGLKIGAGEIATGGLALLWIIRGGLKKINKNNIPTFVYISLVYIAIIGISAVNATNYIVVLREFVQNSIYFLIIPIMIITSMDKKDVIRAVQYFVIIGVIVAAIGVIIWLLGNKPYALVSHLLSQDTLGISHRETGIFGHYNVFGAAMTLVLPLVLSLMLFERRRNKKIQFVMYLIILCLGIVATFSRGAILGSVIAGAFLVYIYPISYFRSIYTGSVIGGVILLLTSLLISIPIPRNAIERIVSGAIVGGEGRFVLWDASFGMIQDYPLLGVGAGNFSERVLEYVSYQQDTAHNLYLNIAAETGILGLLVFLVILFFIVKPLWKYLKIERETKEYDVYFSIVAGVTASIIAFLVDNIATPLIVTGVAIPFFCLVSYAHVIAAQNKQ